MDDNQSQLSAGNHLENCETECMPSETKENDETVTTEIKQDCSDIQEGASELEGEAEAAILDIKNEGIGNDCTEKNAATEMTETGERSIEKKEISEIEEETELIETDQTEEDETSKTKETVQVDEEKNQTIQKDVIEEVNTQNKETIGLEAEIHKATKETEKESECKKEENENKETSQTRAKQTAKDKNAACKETASAVKEKTSHPPKKESARIKERQERKTDLPRSRTMPKSHGPATRKDIAEKFGGVATSGIRVQRSTSCGANAVKNMLLDWCRAKTRNREGVDIQNFSSSWSDGLAFCALILAFFPDEFDFDSLDPKNRRENFQLAFSAAERLADCPPLLDVEDMVRMKVPDSKCVYTYVQELYRSLVSKGLVKTKKA
ncbi:smoothelin-like protein 1 [Bombina bombina]|uniref:smoothelin-like protein 1 n=1 Tax=Bombina bombina TaxID=8345 RepID=UPI00235AE814|nr:smoothelin-like protein 1 [Bombina bombina]